MNNSLRSYSKRKVAFHPLFFDFTWWRFCCKMSGRFQSESVAVFIGIRIFADKDYDWSLAVRFGWQKPYELRGSRFVWGWGEIPWSTRKV